jgi:hypothetical protein
VDSNAAEEDALLAEVFEAEDPAVLEAGSTTSSSSSSSSSSSGSSSGSDVEVVEELRARAQAAAHAPHRITETTSMWRGFKFTHVRASGVHVGFEATCYNVDHAGVTMCRRTLRWKQGETEEICLRRLRWWCIARRQCASREAHKALPHAGPKGGVLPSLAALETLEADYAPASSPGRNQEPKRPRSG